MIKDQLIKIGEGHAGVLSFKNGSRGNYGSIRIDGDNFVYYTGKGLREMWPQNGIETELSKSLKAMDEKSLIASNHIAITPISEIKAIES